MEHLKIKFKNGSVSVRGELTEKHLEDAIRELRKTQKLIAEGKSVKNVRVKPKLTVVQKWQRMNERAKEDLCRMVVGNPQACEISYIGLEKHYDHV